MSRKKITDLTEATTAKTDHYIPVDHETDGTQKMSMSTLVEAVNEAAQGEGLTQTEKNLILDLFEKAAYADDDASTKYEALKTLWTGYSVTWNGSGFSKSNNASGVTAGDTFTSTITANTGKTIESVTVTMGGTTVTGAYSSGTVTIPNVTGDIVITVETSQITVSSISAVYTQTGTVYDTDSLDSLKNDLVVTATFMDSSTGVISPTDYTLSGTLTVGTSTITVSYGGKTTTFNVTVTENTVITGYTSVGTPNISGNEFTPSADGYIKTTEVFSPGDSSWAIRLKVARSATAGRNFENLYRAADASNTAKRATFIQALGPDHKLYISSNDSSNDIVNAQIFTISNGDVKYIEIAFDGNQTYTAKTSTDGETWTTELTQESSSKIYSGDYIAFGGPNSGTTPYEGIIYMDTIKIYVDGDLWWQATA